MNKPEFFELLNDNQSEIVLSKTTIRTVQRGSVVEIVLAIRGYGVFTLSRHKPASQKLTLNEEKFVRWFDEWSESPSEEAVVTDHVALFDQVEFVSMRPLHELQAKKSRTFIRQKSHSKKNKEYPQTFTQLRSAWRLDVTRQDYYLPNPMGRINLSDSNTYVFNQHKKLYSDHTHHRNLLQSFNHLFGSGQKFAAFSSGMFRIQV